MRAREIISIIKHALHFVEEGQSIQVGFFLCTGGTASLLIDKRLYHIHRHTLVMLYPNAQIHVVEHSDDWEGRIEIDYVESYYPTLEAIDVRDRVAVRSCPCIDVAEETADYLHHLCDLVMGDSPLTCVIPQHSVPHIGIEKLSAYRNRYLRSAMLVEVIGLFLTQSPKEGHTPGKHENVVNNFLLLLLQYANAERTVQYYADHLHLSPYYLSGIIKQETGKTALEWINMFTINLCKHYLADTDMSIKEIADTLNFPDQSTFGRYFKRHMGCSPGEYRRG